MSVSKVGGKSTIDPAAFGKARRGRPKSAQGGVCAALGYGRQTTSQEPQRGALSAPGDSTNQRRCTPERIRPCRVRATILFRPRWGFLNLSRGSNDPGLRQAPPWAGIGRPVGPQPLGQCQVGIAATAGKSKWRWRSSILHQLLRRSPRCGVPSAFCGFPPPLWPRLFSSGILIYFD